MAVDLETAFDEALAAAEAAGDTDDFTEIPNAEINMGDDDGFDDETDDESDEGDEYEDDSDTDDDDGVTGEAEDFLAKFKDQKVTVKVQGELIEVPLSELASGYMRNKDYTQKTQQAAELRAQAEWGARLQQAFRDDPQGAIRYLQQAFKVNAEPEIDPYEDIDPEVLPLVKDLQSTKAELARMQQELARQEDARIMAEVRAEVQAVRDEFPDFDANKVLPLAAEKGLSIREAYLLAEAQSILEGKKTTKELTKKSEKIVEREAKKREVAKKVASGASKQVSSKAAQMPDFDSFEEMLEWNISHAR